ncbi:MAG: T9SS type A sorting domain-containing protein [Sporocytophaga sp.]|uniref:T9SS type A sorting domain-containing protein n=1 Tax=Sporocytophaga sp. TaxID=2231183 RepID=UPI001B052615|nr:T9SS type A sorting domain-containing protein [Sporocytophaga sp.]MBO9703671.1 T9SS type A sorting domain-containing protein [Sporocytophaga sp.]
MKNLLKIYFSMNCWSKPIQICSLVIIFYCLATSSVFGQITLEKTYSFPNEPYLETELQLIKLSSGGQKWGVLDAKLDEENYKLTLYNLDHSLYKTIPIPHGCPSSTPGINNFIISGISDNLFNSDNTIEFGIMYTCRSNSSGSLSIDSTIIKVIDENGSILFSKDSVAFNGLDWDNLPLGKCMIKSFGFSNTTTGTKMILNNKLFYGPSTNIQYFIYTLPGKLNTTSTLLKKDVLNNLEMSFPSPNPSNGIAKIDFNLPYGSNGEIFFFNANGNLIKTYNVDSQSSSLIINNSDLQTGTYYYQLSTIESFSETKKMLVIR